MRLFAKRFTGTENVPTFECESGEEEFVHFLEEDALEFQKEKMCNVFIFSDGEKIVGYCAISNDVVKSPRLIENTLIPKKFGIPSCKIGRLFVDKRYRGEGYGAEIVDWCINKALEDSNVYSCRLVIVDAAKEKVRWYQARGFELIPEQKSQKKENYKMFFDLALFNA